MDLTKQTTWVAVTGPESAGKSSLCEALAEASGWPWVAEAARFHPLVLAAEGRCSVEEIGEVWASQTHWALAADRFAARSGVAGVILDTWALVPEVWSEEVHGVQRTDTSAWRRFPDAYIVCAPVLPWVPDPLRSLPDVADRWRLFHNYVEKVRQTGRPFVVYAPDAGTWVGPEVVDAAHKKSTPEACFFEFVAVLP